MQAESDNAKRARAVEALARGANQSEAARQSGYSRMHLTRLVKDPAFAARVERRRLELAGERETAGGPSDQDLAALERRSLAFLGRVVDGQEKDAEIRDRIAAARALAAHAVVARGRLPLAVVTPTPAAPAAAPLRVLDPLSPEAQEQAQSWLDRA